jgi:hypothetical protein
MNGDDARKLWEIMEKVRQDPKVVNVEDVR